MLKGKVFYPVLVLALLLYGCAARIHSFTDDATSARIERMSGNRLAGGMWRLELDAQRHEKGRQVSYSLFVVYSGPVFAAIEPGKTLALTIDGRKIGIEGSGSAGHRDVILPGLVEETAFYHDIDRQLIHEITYAQRVTVEVRGTSFVLQRHFKERNFTSFRAFYENIVSRDAPSGNLPHHGALRVAP